MKFTLVGGAGSDKLTQSYLLLGTCVLIHTAIAIANIESNGDGSYCIAKIPKRGVAANCTSDAVCEDLLGISAESAPPQRYILRCGEQGECLIRQTPQNEYCKEACEKSPCGKLCLQEHETKTAMYCIETRDHPNAMPPNSNVPPNKYYCTCMTTEQDSQYYNYHYHRHRVVGRYLH